MSTIRSNKETISFSHKCFINRELSWLRFNFRVLQEASRKTNPLLERLKFLSIVASNLDEFFEIRVSALEQKLASKISAKDIAGLTISQILQRLYKGIDYLVKKLYQNWNQDIIPNLSKEGFPILSYHELSDEQREYVEKMYYEEFHPILTPIKIDVTHPFPWIINKSLCIAVALQLEAESNKKEIGVVTVPRLLPRIIKIPALRGEKMTLIFLSAIIEENLDALFKGYNIHAKAPFRVTRNSNLYLNEEEAFDLLEAIETELHNRKKGDAVRLEIRAGTPKSLVKQLKEAFQLHERQVHLVKGPVNFNRVMSIYEMIEKESLKYKPFNSQESECLLKRENIFQKIKENDFMLHHPYDSFKPVIYFVQKATEDPDVLAIKMTLYRTDTDSPLMHSLIQAAREGKEVTVVVELKARFDEASNITWAKHLLDNGVHVVYGLLGLKTHCKLILLIRMENKKVVKYVHIGTGNYNEKTANFYTDISLFTCKKEITTDVMEVFNFLTSQSKHPHFKKLLVAPYFMKKKFLNLIDNEKKAAKEGQAAEIIFKVNGLQEADIIEALYKASQAGVKIYGIVRSICCLRVGKKGYSDNIKIISLIGRFLEHSRIFYFKNARPHRLYIASADWMPRNLTRRIEIAIPILDQEIENKILNEILNWQLNDTFNARPLGKGWVPVTERSKDFFHSQEAFMRLARNKKV